MISSGRYLRESDCEFATQSWNVIGCLWRSYAKYYIDYYEYLKRQEPTFSVKFEAPRENP
jgi:hypothetical protein